MLKKAMPAILLGLIIFAFAGCSNDTILNDQGTATQTSTVPFTGPANKSLVWSDEFNGTGAPNWTYDVGGGGWGNNELEYYRSGSANANCSGGLLTITGKKESYGGRSYTSARMNTYGHFSRTYGYIEGRIKCPMGQGLWPAFWGIGTNFGSVGWPKCGELDIMEHVNSNGSIVGTMHWDWNGHVLYNATKACSPGGWNTYAIWWTPTFIRWYVNGSQYLEGNITINNTEEFQRPFFLILNLAIGGDWPGAPNSSTVFPALYQIDYVRWYTEN
jgi:beta-glucanase (GH16 family)